MNIRKQSDIYILSTLLGSILALAMPPFNIFVFIFIALPIFYKILLQSENGKVAILLSWWFGFAYFTTSIYWVVYPLMIEPKSFGWLIPFAIFGLPSLMAMFFSLAGLIVYILKYKGFIGAIVFSLAFTTAEWLLGNYFFYGFPWNLFSYAWSFSVEMLQITSIIGSYGLVFMTLFCGVAFGTYYYDKSKLSLIVSITLLAANFLYGSFRLSTAEKQTQPGVKLRLVQANEQDIYQRDYTIAEANRVIDKYLRLTKAPGFDDITHVIWSESAMPFAIDHSNKLPNLMKIQKFLIFGGKRLAKDNKVYNSLFIMNNKGEIITYYDKHHLVPFGEFIPLYNIMKYLLPNSIVGNAYSGSEKNKTIFLDNTPPFTPLICYESIFPGKVVNRQSQVKWMINITNDLWFAISSEPYQHFAMSRVRSIEEGIPLVRVANSGISAVVDSYGRIIKSLPIMVEGIIDCELPESLQHSTVYSKYFNDKKIIIYSMLILLILTIYQLFNTKNKV